MQTLEEIENIIRENPAVMLYFSAPTCNVCKALKPKLVDAIETNFDQFKIVSIDVSETPNISSHYTVFAIPTVLIFLDGREFLRKSRHMSIAEVVSAIERPYEIMTS